MTFLEKLEAAKHAANKLEDDTESNAWYEGLTDAQSAYFSTVSPSFTLELIEKFEKMRETLKYYANGSNYSLDEYRGLSGEMMCRVVLYGDSDEINDVSQHAGRRARLALKELEK